MLSFNHCNDFSYVHESILFLFLLLQLSLNLGSFAMYESNCMLLTVTGLWVHTERHPGQGELRAFEKASFCLKKKTQKYRQAQLYNDMKLADIQYKPCCEF